jgi:hypothetical protein
MFANCGIAHTVWHLADALVGGQQAMTTDTACATVAQREFQPL